MYVLGIKTEIITAATKAVFKGLQPDTEIDNVSIDSRSLQNNSGTLFFALQGQNKDAHAFIAELIDKGVNNFVVTHIPKAVEDKANFFVVDDTLKALQSFATYYRQLFNFPIIAITGSNGKTIVKEWLNYLLSPDYDIIRSPKSYNSQIGVPLSVIAINQKHSLGIFEAGISTVGEMEKLESIIRPTVGVLTNIGSAHDEGFATREEKITEKLKLFKNVNVVILQKNEAVERLLSKDVTTFTWSYDSTAGADVTISKTKDKANTILQVTYKETFKVSIPFTDAVFTENAINCLMVLLHFGYNAESIAQRLATLYPVELRLQIKNGINNCTVIDDSYSSDYQSLKIALDFLEQQKTHQKKTVIISDVFQSGFDTDELYRKVRQLLTDNNITRVIGIGETITKQLADFPNFYPYKTTQEFLAQFNPNGYQNETILLKGARSFRFEEILVLLEDKTHETVLEINLTALIHNLNFYRSRLKPNTKTMAMVKAFGYGSGSYEIAKALSHHKIDYLGVAFSDEGVALRNAGINTPIIVMNPEVSAFSAMIAYKLEPEIYSINELQAFLNIARKKNLSEYPIHIKLDTGMHRLGFEENQLEELISILQNNNFVSVKSIFSHLSASDDVQFSNFTHQQINLFEKWSNLLMESLQINPIRHILNTSGIYNYPEAQYDMVRIGIGLYGVGNDVEETKLLEKIGTLKTTILQIKEITAGESVGYSRNYMATEKIKIATIPVGYADGIARAWSKQGYVTIKGKKAPITGNICMDMMMIDVTDIDCKEGDSVEVFGKNPSVIDMAKAINTIPYEVLTGISQRVKRVFYKE